MVRARAEQVVETLRQRILRAIATGALCAGDRVPSTREMARELAADPRLIAKAYRVLEADGIVELRARSGVYIRVDAPTARIASIPGVPTLVDLLTQSGLCGHPAPQLVRSLHTMVNRRAVRAMVIATTADQGLGIARELKEDFGLDAASVLFDRVNGDDVPAAVRNAQLLVTTQLHGRFVARLAEQLSTPHVVIAVRHDLFESEWALWRGQTVHVVVLDPRFRRLVNRFLAEQGEDTAAVRVHLATDDLSRIADDAPTYVTQAARTHLGRLKVPGMLIPPTRLFAEDCIRTLWGAIGELNLGSNRG